MIRLSTVDGVPYAEMWTENPSIYLDHWAIRNLASDTALQNDFFAAFKDRGTLMFSIMNVVEIAGNTGQSAAEIRAFLERVGPHWFLNTMDPLNVIAKEQTWKAGDSNPATGEVFFAEPRFAAKQARE